MWRRFYLQRATKRPENNEANISDLGALELQNDLTTISGLPTDVVVVEETAADLDLSAVSLGDVDGNVGFAVTLTADTGTMTATSGGLVTVTGSGTGALVLTGLVADIDTFLNTASAIQYTGGTDVAGDNAATITLSANDGFGDEALGSVNVDITAVSKTVQVGGGGSTLEGGAANDVLSASSGSNTINAGDGNDLLAGGFDNDKLFGGAGDDLLLGDNKSFIGGADILNGGTGDDLLEGGGGADTFVFATNDGSDTIGSIDLDYDNFANSTVTDPDFESGVDTIQLAGFALADEAAALAKVTDVGGVATFSAEGTTITFAGLTTDDLNANDFFLL